MNDQITKATTDAAAAFAAGEAAARSNRTPFIHKDEHTGIPFLFQPSQSGDGWDRVSLEKRMPAPRRITTVVHVTTPRAFIDYMKLFAKGDRSIVLVQTPVLGEAVRFTGLIDYHVGDQASWIGHRVDLELPTTDEWDGWVSQDNKPMGQVEFAQFLEDRIPEIAEPNAALLVEMARAFEAFSEVNFKSVDVARDGSRVLKFEEKINEVPRPGGMPLPTQIKLVVAPYEGTDKAVVEARIRYTLGGGSLKLRYLLIRPQDALLQSFSEARTQIADELREHVRVVIDASSFDTSAAEQ